MLIYREKKTGFLFRHLAIAVNKSFAYHDCLMVVYCPDDDEHSVYVRKKTEFDLCFELVEGGAVQ